MAVSMSELTLIRNALNRLSGEAAKQMRNSFNALTRDGRIPTSAEVLNIWLILVEAFGGSAAALGADLFEAQAADLEIKPKVKLSPGASRAEIIARARWALQQANQLGNLTTLLDELVKRPYRDTYMDSAAASGVGWARVPKGKTCNWCRMLASRGAVYFSADSAGESRKYHGDCDCQPVLVRDERDYPPGYDPDELYQEYLQTQE